MRRAILLGVLALLLAGCGQALVAGKVGVEPVDALARMRALLPGR